MSSEITFADLAVDGIPFPLVPPFELEEIPIPIDILDTLVSRYLPGLAPGWVEFQREEITPVSIKYILSQSDLGELGTVELFKTGDKEASMSVSTPSLAFESKEVKDRRREHNKQVIQVLFNLLAADTTWKKYWKKTREQWQEVGHSVETTSQLLSRMEAMHSDLGARIDLVQRSVITINKHIDGQTKSDLESILQEIRLGRIEQGKMQSVLDSIRRALKYQQINNGFLKDKELKEVLEKILQSINSGLSLHESLELAIPVIPLFLTYKVELGADVDLIATWNELVERIQNIGNAK